MDELSLPLLLASFENFEKVVFPDSLRTKLSMGVGMNILENTIVFRSYKLMCDL